MGVQFYPAVNYFGETLILDVNVFNAQGIFKMLSIQGETNEGTVGLIEISMLQSKLEHMDKYIQDCRWMDNGWSQDQVDRYSAKLLLIIGYCLGKSCHLCWS